MSSLGDEVLPSGTVSFLFTDIEGSTRRWESYPDAMRLALREHDRIAREAIVGHGGYIFKTIGDAFCAAFVRTDIALAAAVALQRNLARVDFSAVDDLRVRVAVHVGSADERDGDYFGAVVNRVARLLAVGHGGQILVSAIAADLARNALASDLDFHDLGSHRLKDLATPERVYQLNVLDLERSFPPLRSLSTHRNNLPLQLTSFLGRDDLLADLRQRLRDTRLLTLVGTGGVGKTRLAVQLGADVLERFPDGVWFVDLAALENDETLADHIAKDIEAPVSARAPARESVIAALRHRNALLILDNCEHHTASIADVAGAILQTAPNVRIVATSREPLGIAGEAVRRVDSLSYPPEDANVDAKSALDYGAIALLVERMRAATDRIVFDDERAPIFAEIARRLDGIPLALELAAAKIVVLSPRDIARRLDERFRLLTGDSRSLLPRQKTMRAMIDWSYDFLADRERTLFVRLAIFSGGWTLASASEICSDAAIDAWDVLELLTSLVRKSLVIVDAASDGDRYRFLESTREYAKEKLLASGEAETLALRHARSFHDFVVRVGSWWDAMDDRAWQRAVAGDIENLRAGFEWALARPETAKLAIESLVEIRQARLVVNIPESLRRIEAALARVDHADIELLAGLRLKRAGLVLYTGASVDEFVGAAELAYATAREVGNHDLIIRASVSFANALRAAGSLDEANDLLAAVAPPGNGQQVTRSSIELQCDWGAIALVRGDIDGARERLSAALRDAKSGSLVHATSLAHIAELEALVSNIPAARAAALAAKGEFAELGSRLNVGVICNNLAAYALAVDAYDETIAFLDEGLPILRDFGSRTFLLQSIEHHALLAAARGDYDTALHLFGYTDHHFGRIGAPREGIDLAGYARLVAILERNVAVDHRRRQLALGATLDEDGAIAHVRALHPGWKTSGQAL